MLCVVEIVIRIEMIAKKMSEQDFLSLEEDDLLSSLPKKIRIMVLWRKNLNGSYERF